MPGIMVQMIKVGEETGNQHHIEDGGALLQQGS